MKKRMVVEENEDEEENEKEEEEEEEGWVYNKRRESKSREGGQGVRGSGYLIENSIKFEEFN